MASNKQIMLAVTGLVFVAAWLTQVHELLTLIVVCTVGMKLKFKTEV
jgi:hypothetical protein